MSEQPAGRVYWGLLWRSENQIDGYREHVMFNDCRPLLFDTREQARRYRDEKYGYIRNRKDLQGEPCGWRLPTPIRINLKFEYERQ